MPRMKSTSPIRSPQTAAAHADEGAQQHSRLQVLREGVVQGQSCSVVATYGR